MNIDNIREIINIPIDIDLYNDRSVRVATQFQVIKSYRNMYRFLRDARQKSPGIDDQNVGRPMVLRTFHTILGNFLILLAHSEPMKFRDYQQKYVIEISGVDVSFSINDLINQLDCTALQFLNAHADTVYRLARKNAISFEFGTLMGLNPNFPGVGFVGFLYTTHDSLNERQAFLDMLNRNEFLRKFFFNSKIY